MSDLEFTFEDSPLDLALVATQKNGKLSATSFLTMMEGVSEDALEEAPDNAAQIDRFLEQKLRGRQPDEKEKKRLSDALLRRGYPWGDVKAALNRLGAEIWED
jgi:SOS response regulatory protein OraA/RecX